MASDQWQRAKEIFGEAVDLDPPQREAYVRKASNGDPALIAEVLSLLEKDSPDAFFQNPIERPANSPILLEGRYWLEAEIGRGGFGVVYTARDQRLHGRKVVIKMPLLQYTTGTWPSEKFAEEVKALARIDHPGVVGALDRGTCPDGRPFFVMQFVEGRSLRSVIVEGGMALDRISDIAAQIGRALGAAHKGHVWHRDLKPENIMVQALPEGGEQVRLIDFGIATVKDAHDAEKEVQTRAVGSLSYMAPEQLSGHVSQATDLYAFGLIAYEMLTGQKPFTVTSPGELLEQQKAGVPVTPKQLRSNVPPAAERLVLQALAYRQEVRPHDAARFGEELARSLRTPVGTGMMTRRTALAASILAACAAGITTTVWQLRRPTPPAPTLTYSLMIQKMSDGQTPAMPQFLQIGQTLRTSDSFLILVRTSRTGHLYLLSEELGNDSINTLFPAPFMYQGSSLVRAGDLKRIPEDSSFAFNSEPRVVILWSIWSTEEIRQFEDLQRWINEHDRGALGDAREKALIRAALAKLPEAATIVSSGHSEQTLKITASRLAWRIKMETKP